MHPESDTGSSPGKSLQDQGPRIGHDCGMSDGEGDSIGRLHVDSPCAVSNPCHRSTKWRNPQLGSRIRFEVPKSFDPSACIDCPAQQTHHGSRIRMRHVLPDLLACQISSASLSDMAVQPAGLPEAQVSSKNNRLSESFAKCSSAPGRGHGSPHLCVVVVVASVWMPNHRHGGRLHAFSPGKLLSARQTHRLSGSIGRATREASVVFSLGGAGPVDWCNRWGSRIWGSHSSSDSATP
jgi:hypothetical protein